MSTSDSTHKSAKPRGRRAQTSQPQSASGHRLIIRQAIIQSGKRRLIGGSSAEPAREAMAELLYDGDEVTGVHMRCVCGKATEIYFDYEDPK